ncbi:MAG: hypothetical protein M1831_003815 [Alyxoria varia]|nr:MAG: hypothetical protein M1831_003815 [Alyxoria varia]
MASESHGPVYLSTLDAYERWATVYDSDGNILQAVDDYMLGEHGLLSLFLKSVVSAHLAAEDDPRLNFIDFGAGTGRNSAKVILSPELQNIKGSKSLVLLDLSPKMLEIAKERCDGSLEALRHAHSVQSHLDFELSYHSFDALSSVASDQAINLPQARGIISTLVVEHIPLESYFARIADMLASKKCATYPKTPRTESSTTEKDTQSQWDWLLITNMHNEMGARSQAGFTDPNTGQKTRAKSYVHTPHAIIEEGRNWGFEPIELGSASMAQSSLVHHVTDKAEHTATDALFLERAITSEDLKKGLFGGISGRGRKWIGVNVWYGMIVRRRRSLSAI